MALRYRPWARSFYDVPIDGFRVGLDLKIQPKAVKSDDAPRKY
jgi:hypothetical protein